MSVQEALKADADVEGSADALNRAVSFIPPEDVRTIQVLNAILSQRVKLPATAEESVPYTDEIDLVVFG